MDSQNNQPPRDDLLWRHLKTLPAFRAVLRAVEARFYHQINLPEPILDLGCGDGNFAELTFNEYDRKLTVGLDPWWGPLNKSQAAEVYQDGVTQGMGDRMPFPSNHFASAISNSVLEHIPDIQPVLNETGRVLQMDSKFVITMPNHRFTELLGGAQLAEKAGLDSLADQYRKGFNFISRHAHTCDVNWWAEKLATAGLQIERWQYYFSPKALHALEIGHAQGLPAAIIHALTGQWVIAPTENNLALVDQWLRPFFLEQANQDDPEQQGTYLLIIARKVSDHPIEVQIPAARPFTVDPNGNLIQDETTDAPPLPTPIAAPPPASLPSADPLDPPAPSPTSDDEATDSHPEENPDTSSFSLQGALATYGRQIGFSTAAFICSFFAYSVTSENPRTYFALFLWLCAIGLVSYAFWPSDASKIFADLRNWRDPDLARERVWIPAALFLVALILRTVLLSQHPFILSGTEANIGLEAVVVAQGVWGNPFSTGILTNPVLPFTLIGTSVGIFGRTPFALRIISALIGALTIPLLYTIGRKLWRWEVGLLAAFFLLGTHTHLHYSRLGLTNIWDPMFALLTFYFLHRVWQSNDDDTAPKPRHIYLLGLVMGLSAFFYTSLHLTPLLIGAFLVLQLPFDLHSVWRNGRAFLISFVIALVVALPTLRFYNQNPGVFLDRSDTFGIYQNNWIFDEASRAGTSINTVLVDQFQRAFTGFTHTADTSLYYGPNQALLGLTLALIWAIGLIISLIYLNDLRHRQLLLWHIITITFAGAMLLSPPASHRLLIVIPLACLTAALPLNEALRLLDGRWPPLKEFGFRIAVLTCLALAFVAPETLFYFRDYRQDAQFADRNTEIAHELGRFLAENPNTGQITYFYGAPILYTSFPNITYLAPNAIPQENLFDVPPEETENVFDSVTNGQVHVFIPERDGDLQRLMAQQPNGRLETVSGSHANPLFTIYHLP